MPNLTTLLIRPPLVIARLGGSSRPLESFQWRTDPTIHGASRTVIEPTVTLDVAQDGSVAPYYPGVIRFRDSGKLRPIAPFFELWAQIVYRKDDPPEMLAQAHANPGDSAEVALTRTLLRSMGADLASVVYQIRLGNRKAARRTGDDANAYEAALSVKGDDHAAKPLLAFTPPRPGLDPLVSADRPIPLGAFQVLRPVRRSELGVDLDVLRFRYTPAAGQVYGPPTAANARSNTSNDIFEIVPPENRILNPRSSWCVYDGDYSKYDNPEPYDTYDGADQDGHVAWGVVDDACDGAISASVVVGARRFAASARVIVGPPDFAPDRRPFVTLADDLSDRDCEPAAADEFGDEGKREAIKQTVADLFERVFETASLINLDQIRSRAIGDNGGLQRPQPPFTDQRSMTAKDTGFADEKVKAIVRPKESAPLQFTPLVGLAHAPLADDDELFDFISTKAERARKMLRPAYGAFAELTPVVRNDAPAETHRDPRSDLDRAHDMRMPPYMRDEMASALSLTRRQYLEVQRLIDALAERKRAFAAAQLSLAAPAIPETDSELRKRVRAVLARASAARRP